MITESDIDSFIVSMEAQTSGQDDDYPTELEDYLEAEIFPNLTKEEAEVLHFCLTVIYGTIKSAKSGKKFDLDEYMDAEEANWAFRDKNKSFISSLDKYFDDYPEEDLLAFVEDMIVDDEDQELSIAGQEIIFISAKSLIDQQKGIKS